MKYKVYAVTCGEKKTLLETDILTEARNMYKRIAARGGYARVSIDGKTLPICKADSLMGRRDSGITV